jgi:hypothetical protein
VVEPTTAAYALRGRCRELSEAAVSADPSLRLVRGWYHDPSWGAQEHWWTERPDGSIFDPTAAQFPQDGIACLYEEYRGVFPCQGCGVEVHEENEERYDSCCTYTCYGRMVGVL